MDTKEFDARNEEKSRSVCERIEMEDAGRDYETEASYLRSKLNAAEDKAERRLHHARYLESVIRDRNAKLKERKQRIHELTNEVRRLGKQVSDLAAELEDTNRMLKESDQLSERERQILDMWPRFEDGEYVWFGDEVGAPGVKATEVYVSEIAAAIWNNHRGHVHLALGERAPRPAPKDSWEQLEEDAEKDECDYFKQSYDDCGGCPAEGVNVDCRKVMTEDIIRRAKALAGVEG